MKIGDTVSVIDENISGTITAMHGGRATLRDEHGFTQQFPLEQLVLKDGSIYDCLQVERKAEPRKIQSKKHNSKPLVLDLHFEKLVENPGAHDSFSRLFIQKEKLISTLEFCRTHRLKKLEIIHGIGDGILQKMVYDTLQAQTGVEFHNREILHEQSGTVMVYFL